MQRTYVQRLSEPYSNKYIPVEKDLQELKAEVLATAEQGLILDKLLLRQRDITLKALDKCNMLQTLSENSKIRYQLIVRFSAEQG